MSKFSYKLLRQKVEQKAGFTISSARDCKALSVILEETVGVKVSETTIKRFWHIVNCDVSPSRYTLNSLAQYVDYRDFNEYDLLIISENDDSNETWEKLRTKAMELSLFSLRSTEARMGSQRYAASIRREVTRDFFECFCHSGKIATAVVAPTGWGKSIAMAQIAEDYFIKPCALMGRDILFYFDIESVSSMASYRDFLEDFFLSLIGLRDEYNFKSIFSQHPNWIKGKIYLFFDGVSKRQIKNILTVINNYVEVDYIRVMFSVLPMDWMSVSGNVPHELREHLWNLKCDVFDTLYCNVPQLNMSERITILKKVNCFDVFTYSLLYSSDIRQLMGVPSLMERMVTVYKNGNLSEVTLFWDIFLNKLCTGKDKMRRVGFVELLIKTSNCGLLSSVEIKDETFQLLETYQRDLEVLCAVGILSISTRDGIMDGSTHLNFAVSSFLEFIIATYWIHEVRGNINSQILERMLEFYIYNEALLVRILGWIIRFAFNKGDVAFINGLWKFIDQNIKSLVNQRSLKFLICKEYAFYPNLHGKVLSTDEELCYLVSDFCDLDHLDTVMNNAINELLSRKSCAKYYMPAYIMKMYAAFLHEDKMACGEIYGEMTEHISQMKSPSNLEFIIQFAGQLMYYTLVDDKIPRSSLDYMMKSAEQYFSDDSNYLLEFLGICVVLLDVLAMTSNYKLALKLTEIVLRVTENRKDSFMYTSIRLMNVSALYNLGKRELALERFNSMDIPSWLANLPLNSFLFGALRLSFVSCMLEAPNLEHSMSYFKMLIDYFHHERFLRRMGDKLKEV